MKDLHILTIALGITLGASVAYGEDEEKIPSLSAEDFQGKKGDLTIRGRKIDFDNVDLLIRYCKQEPKVKVLDLWCCELAPEVFAKILGIPTLMTFGLNGSHIDAESAEAISSALEKNTTLKKLNLSWCGIGDEGAVAISRALEKNTSLTKLNLSWCGIGDKGAVAISSALKKNTTLKMLLDEKKKGDLTIRGRKIDFDNVNLLISYCKQEPKVKVLDLWCCELAPEVFAKILGIPTLITFGLSGSHIDAESVKAISSALKKNTTLRYLALTNNYICPESIVWLANALELNTTLTKFKLSANSINTAGAGVLFGKLGGALSTLDLSYNAIEDGEWDEITNSLALNTTLTTLNLRGNPMHDKGAVAISSALKENTTLTTLNLSWCVIGDEGAVAISSALKENTTLTTLNLGLNDIHATGVMMLFEVLRRNEALRELVLECNNIGTGIFAMITSALEGNTTLTTLDLSDNGLWNEDVEESKSLEERKSLSESKSLEERKILLERKPALKVVFSKSEIPGPRILGSFF